MVSMKAASMMFPVASYQYVYGMGSVVVKPSIYRDANQSSKARTLHERQRQSHQLTPPRSPTTARRRDTRVLRVTVSRQSTKSTTSTTPPDGDHRICSRWGDDCMSCLAYNGNALAERSTRHFR